MTTFRVTLWWGANNLIGSPGGQQKMGLTLEKGTNWLSSFQFQ